MRESPLCEIRMSTEFKSFTQDGDSVDAVVTNTAGEDEHIHAQFIVSAEGGRSIVRKTLDIEFEGYTYPERTLTVAVCHDFDKIRGYSYRNYLFFSSL